MQQECRDMAQALAMGPSACRMPPPPARAPPAHKDAHGAEPHGRSLIAMHVAAAPHTPSAVVLFGVDASRTSTCITLPTAMRVGVRWDTDGRSVAYINGRKQTVCVLSTAESTTHEDTLGIDVLQHHGDAADPELADPVALLML